MREHPQSTRNNSIVERLMLEDLSLPHLSAETITLDDSVLSYTCEECNYRTTSKGSMDDHIRLEHEPFENQEVFFSCKECNHDFKEIDDYSSHMRNHKKDKENVDKETTTTEKESSSPTSNNVVEELLVGDFGDLERMVYNFILEQYNDTQPTVPVSINSSMTDKSGPLYKCDECPFCDSTTDSLKEHKKSQHRTEASLPPSVFLHSCISCEFETNDYLQLMKHIEDTHRSTAAPIPAPTRHKCNFCEYLAYKTNMYIYPLIG